MLRMVLSAIGIIELVSPQALIEAAERIALENPAECELRRWVGPGARMEGLVFLFMMWRSDASYAAFKRFLGVIGILALLYPRSYVDYGSSLAYTEGSDPDWQGWVYPGTRVIGLLYVLVALDELLG
jgi:hypothetical protein